MFMVKVKQVIGIGGCVVILKRDVNDPSNPVRTKMSFFVVVLYDEDHHT
jgi:hypothetical protein